MKWLKQPWLWFLLAVLLITAGGGHLLNDPACKAHYDDDWHRYGEMNIWQAVFDALSATCGVGLLTCDMDEEYTARGRWILTGLGLVGAVFYLAAAWQVARRLWSACGERVPLPGIWSILLLFIALLALCVPLAGVLEWLAGGAGTLDETAWRAVSAVASLGWLPGAPARSCTWIYAVVALIGGLGWMVWLLLVPAWRKRYLFVPRVLGLAGGYVLFLLLAASLIFVLESPRGGRGGLVDELSLTGQPPAARYARSLVQTVCASTAGIPTESLIDRNVTEGTKTILAAVMLIGPLGGSAGGGIKWTLLLWGLGGGAAVIFVRKRSTNPAAARCLLAGVGCLLLIVLLVTVTALGMLVIETHTASLYQSSPTFADAFLDATSAVAGGNLSSGLIQAVTSRNLSRGIRQDVDLYQYGMVWLMAAMLLGRVLPLFILCRAANVRFVDTAHGTPPVI